MGGGAAMLKGPGENTILLSMYDTIDGTHTTQECDIEKLVQE